MYDPSPRYTLESLPGTFSGMQMFSIWYAGMRTIDPNVDPGIDLSREYEAVQASRNRRQD